MRAILILLHPITRQTDTDIMHDEEQAQLQAEQTLSYLSAHAHPNGQWRKKILGKVHFFGIWDDPQAGVARYHAVAADLHAGREHRPEKLAGGDFTVKDACDAYPNCQREKLGPGEMGGRGFEDCRAILKDFAERMGKSVAAVGSLLAESRRQLRRLPGSAFFCRPRLRVAGGKKGLRAL